MKRATILSLAAVSAAVACHSDRSIAPNPAAGRPGISTALVDGSHGGNPHFFFLPPMVPPRLPRFSGVFDPTLTPDVAICTVQTNGTCPEVAHFTTPPPGTPFNPSQVFNRVQVIKNLQFYFVFWRPNWQTLDPTQIQRLRVSVGTQTLGLADIKVVSSEDQFEAVWASKQFVPLIRGGVLLIIFRIEQGAVGAGPPGCNGQPDCTQVTVGPNPTQRVDVVTPSGQAAASFPPGYFEQTVTLTIHQVLELRQEGCFSASSPPRPLVFGCYSYATSPQQVKDVLGCKTSPAENLAERCARVEVCPTLAPTDPRYQHLQLFRSDPEQPVRPLEGEVTATLITCPPPPNLGLGAHGMFDLARASWQGIMTALGGLVSPKSLFAATAMIHRGVGGLTCCFSNMGLALPMRLSTVPGTDHNTAGPGTQVAPDPAVLLEYLHPAPSPASGQPVSFAVVPGSGSVSAASVNTDAGGIASVQWTLGSAPGINQLIATAAADGSPDTITATVCDPSTIIIDGIFCGAEWNSATQFTFNVNLPEGGTTPATLFITNDATNLYLAVRFSRAAVDPGNSLSFEFDSNSDGMLDDGDDGIILNPDIGFKDLVRSSTAPPGGVSCPVGGLCSYFDTQFGGTNDGSAAFHNDGRFTVYEFAHPLNSGDVHDFSRSAGQTLGLTLFLRMIAAGAVFPTGFGDTTFPTGGFQAFTIR